MLAPRKTEDRVAACIFLLVRVCEGMNVNCCTTYIPANAALLYSAAQDTYERLKCACVVACV